MVFTGARCLRPGSKWRNSSRAVGWILRHCLPIPSNLRTTKKHLKRPFPGRLAKCFLRPKLRNTVPNRSDTSLKKGSLWRRYHRVDRVGDIFPVYTGELWCVRNSGRKQLTLGYRHLSQIRRILDGCTELRYLGRVNANSQEKRLNTSKMPLTASLLNLISQFAVYSANVSAQEPALKRFLLNVPALRMTKRKKGEAG